MILMYTQNNRIVLLFFFFFFLYSPNILGENTHIIVYNIVKIIRHFSERF